MSGIVGLYSDHDILEELTYGIYSIQHRGQDFFGLASIDGENIQTFYEKGTLARTLDQDEIVMSGNIGLGYVRSDSDPEKRNKVMPKVFDDGKILLMDGKVINEDFSYEQLKEKLSSDEKTMVDYLSNLEGAFTIIFYDGQRILAMRDTRGVKPLAVGRRDEDNLWLIASETCVFDGVGARIYKDLIPGEIFIIDGGSTKSYYAKDREHKLDLFEMFYIQRPDSVVEGVSVFDARFTAGQLLYKELKTEADLVIGAPDSGIPAALGYAEASGIPYKMGLIKNRYVQRTFQQPVKEDRIQGVRLKLNAIRDVVYGKNVILVDDSIVRGTTIKRTIEVLKQSGARRVHVRVASPPLISGDDLSIVVPYGSDLLAHNKTIEEMEMEIGADSLYFISIEALRESCGNLGFYEGGFHE